MEDFLGRLKAAIRVDAVILFGSYAKGEAREWSDIDLAVVSPDFEGRSQWDRQEIIAKSTVGRAYRIAPIGFASSEYRNSANHAFLREIIRTGREVFRATTR
jgi:predicted nucleotidyltransferase